jgi:hypothetical protein
MRSSAVLSLSRLLVFLASVFVAVRHLCPSLMFASKAGILRQWKVLGWNVQVVERH